MSLIIQFSGFRNSLGVRISFGITRSLKFLEILIILVLKKFDFFLAKFNMVSNLQILSPF